MNRNTSRKSSTASTRSSRQGSVASVGSQHGNKTSQTSSTSSFTMVPSVYTLNFYVDFTSHIPGNKSLRAFGVLPCPSDPTQEECDMQVFDLKKLLDTSFEAQEARNLRVTLAKASRHVWDVSTDPKKTSEQREAARAELDQYTTSRFEIRLTQWILNKSILVDESCRLCKKDTSIDGRPGSTRRLSSSFTGIKRRRSLQASTSSGNNARRQSLILEDPQRLRLISHARG